MIIRIMKITCFRYPVTIISLALFINGNILSQDNTMYFMHDIPQAIYTNPALYYKCKTYIELPVLSSINFSFASTGFGYHDVIRPGTGGRADSLIIDVDNLAEKLKKRNFIRNDVSFNLLGAGFAVKDFYFHFNISNQLESRVGFPGDLVRIKDGNWDPAEGEPKDINLGGLGVTAFNYIQVGVGAAYKPNRNLSVGATAKYLMGTASLVNRRSNLDIITDENLIDITGSVDYRINSSFPIEFDLNDSTYVENVRFTFTDPLHDFIFNKNRGIALDAGIIYNYSEDITLTASIVNLGFIRWNSNVNRFEANGNFTFNGVDLNEYTSREGETDFLGALVDSIRQSFQFKQTVSPYLTLLTTEFFAGGYYRLTNNLNLGVLGKAEIYDSRPHFSFTASANVNPVNFFNATLSYSIMNNKYYHLGAGLGIRGGGTQFYFIADHIPIRMVKITGTPIIFPYNARTFNFRFGMNLVFGCKDRYKEEKTKRGRPKTNRNLCPAYW